MRRLLLTICLALAPSIACAQGSALSGLPSASSVNRTDLFYDLQRTGLGGVKATTAQVGANKLTKQQITSTDNFFVNAGAVLDAFNDRVFIGGATANDGTCCSSSNQDWLEKFQATIGIIPGGMTSVQGGILTNNNASSAGAWLAGVQTLNFTSASASGIGTSSYAINNNATLGTSAWAYYGECHREKAINSQCFGMEVDPRAAVAGQTADPFQQGATVGHQIGCGAGVASTGHPCDAAIQIVPNPETFGTGISFYSGSITSGAGASGTTQAIAMPENYTINWLSAFNTLAATIAADGSANLNLGAVASVNLKNSGSTIAAVSSAGIAVAGKITATNGVYVPQFTIGGLPACSRTTDGMLAEVTNGIASPTYNGAVSGTGSTHDLVFCNGAGWTYH